MDNTGSSLSLGAPFDVWTIYMSVLNGLKMSEKAANVQRKTFGKPGELLLNTPVKESRVCFLGTTI